MDTKMIEVLIKQLEQSSLHELELTLGNDSLHLVKASPAAAPAPATRLRKIRQRHPSRRYRTSRKRMKAQRSKRHWSESFIWLLNQALIRTFKSAITLKKVTLSASSNL